MKDTRITLPVTVELSSDAYNKLSNVKKMKAAEEFSKACSQFLEIFANGGIVVKNDDLKQIEKVCGSSIDNGLMLSNAVQKAKGREDGDHIIGVAIEDALWPAAEEYARVADMAPKEMLTSVCNKIVRDQVSYYINGQTWEPVVYLTEAQASVLKKLLGGKRISGENIIELLAQETMA
jgi:hypothetical protein